MIKTIGVDVGGTNLRVGVFLGHQLIQETRIQANYGLLCQSNPADKAWQAILNMTASGLQEVLSKHQDIEHIGIGFPGFIDPVTENIAQSPNLPGLINVNLAQDLTTLLGKKIIVVNDANAAAYGEYSLAGNPSAGLLYLGLGTGVGSGLILHDKPYLGQHGYAMEAGHIIVKTGGRLCGCGNKGCLEQYASASGVAMTYHKLTQKQQSASEIAQLAYAGDLSAKQAYMLAAETLAQGIATILKVVDVSHVVIGGGMVGAWTLMQDAFNRRLQQDLIPVLRDKVNIQLSKAEDVAGMLGAALLATRA